MERREADELLRATDATKNTSDPSEFSRAADLAPTAAVLLSGERFARYVIVGQLGAGGMGEVYRARDEQLDREVAVKVLPTSSFDDPSARARLVREARAAAALNHPNVRTVYEVGEANGQAYIAMELVEGQTLSAAIAAGPLPLGTVVHYGRQLVDAIIHAHDRGIVHRDLKSNNVIVTRDGRVKVLDFGLARRSPEADLGAATLTHVSLTEPGMVVGTLLYMSPEQLRGETARVPGDIWALGVVLYEMTAGTRPFNGQTAFELSAAILNNPPAPLPGDVPPPLRALIERCLAKEVDRRYRSAADVRSALDDIPVGGVRVSRRRALGGVAAVTLVAVAAVRTWRLFPAAPVHTLAVLPFDNPAQDSDLEYLCEGIADSLIKQTSRLRSLQVRNLTAVLSVTRLADASARGRQLGVATVLTGTLQREGARLRISTRLVDVATGRSVWTRQYDRDAGDLLEIQDEIATAIMDDGLRLSLTTEERTNLVRHPTTDGDAYDLYLQARYLQRRATEDDYLYSRELLQRALVRDPKFALAYAALSGNYAMMITDGLERPATAWPQVRRYIRQALDIDPELPEAYAYSHAVSFLFDWDWPGAERARLRLMEFSVGDFDPHVLRAIALEHWALGRPRDALELARRTRELDPLSSYLAVLEADYLLRTKQFDAAAALYEHAIRGDPANANAHFGLAETRFRQARFDEAITMRRKAHEAAGDDALKDLFATARGEQGYREIERAWVRLQLDALKTRQLTAYVSPLDFARAYAQLAEKELAFKYLNDAFDDRSPGLVFLKVDPAWDSIRGDRRLDAAIRQVGLP